MCVTPNYTQIQLYAVSYILYAFEVFSVRFDGFLNVQQSYFIHRNYNHKMQYKKNYHTRIVHTSHHTIMLRKCQRLARCYYAAGGRMKYINQTARIYGKFLCAQRTQCTLTHNVRKIHNFGKKVFIGLLIFFIFRFFFTK